MNLNSMRADHEVTHLKTTPGWGSISYVKTSFQISPKRFQKVATEFLKTFI